MSEKESVKELAKRLEELASRVTDHEKSFGELYTTLRNLEETGKSTRRQEDERDETVSKGTDYYCPECETYTKDLFSHLKKNPEKHGLVKTVEVTKEVQVPPEKKSIKERLAEHDIFDCPDCRKDVDEYLAKKGLEITKKKETSEWSFEI